MTRPARDVLRVGELLATGATAAEVSRETGIPWRTVRTWQLRGIDELLRRREASRSSEPCSGEGGCHASVSRSGYAYLLGLYLGDGYLAPNGVVSKRLEVGLDARYPRIVAEAAVAVRSCLPVHVQLRARNGCTVVAATSMHWRCLFPQHGAGKKHERRIELAAWQRRIVEQHPERFLRGLVHSDGTRCMNRVGRYTYSRYMFSNRSGDIRALFVEACAMVGVEARQAGRWNVSVATRSGVAILDRFIGPKA